MQKGTSTAAKSHLEEVRRRRAELRESMSELELALAAPVNAHRTRWIHRVQVALMELSADFHLHVQVTEGPGGLHRDLLAASPRLSGAVAHLVQDHQVINDRLEDLLAYLRSVEVVDPENVRTLATALLGRLARHRQHGADLVFDAFQLDLGGED